MIALAVAGLFVGKYPLSVEKLLAGDEIQWRVFLTLRLTRTVVGVIGGFALGVAGFVCQTVFRNPLASPDIIGASSGASAGAAAGIVVGAAVDILWLVFLKDFGLYEIIPGFILSLIAAIVVTLLTPAPSSEVTDIFDRVAAGEDFDAE